MNLNCRIGAVTAPLSGSLMATDSSGDSLMRKSALLVASFTAMALMLGGCASNLTGDSYSRDEARTVQTVRMGTIESLRPVKIEGTKTPIGGAAGAVVGGVGGSAIGGGRGSIVAAVIGAVAGGLLGSATEEGLTRTQGVEITVREDDGSMRAYVQQVQENEIFRVGERVRIMSVNGTSRVTH
ncbi:Membrane protein [Pseudomonas savastanoi pv. glycinea]|nr:putative Outer membrane lipoprotein [Pseudomonas amygdali pv. lachrymans]KPY04167.1 putative Outer membrane lipoprotein [Pseudomonas amygdali pv. mori]KPY52093.1 putative Outer membrane lipoprotein [Pseudomonas syringae pv. rhaphiolepidis]RMM64428.1 putative Outer membrane lipoprotein [Pseudomonas savastanoi pv. glycinea]RMP83572.1 Membrane protein [Pseudomonas syringae pv. actinidiae]RMR11108.1 putative Outer membrane lipoprotein [Pseudomonas amygdali pv. ulmi]RMT90670.1 Membrane protein 